MMTSGTVTVDPTTGAETYTPNNATNYAKRYYLNLLAANASHTTTKTTPGSAPTVDPSTGHVTPGSSPTKSTVVVAVTLTPDLKTKLAAQANMAADIITFLLAQAEVQIVIPASSAGDGLQTTTTNGNPTTHPTAPKTITGGLS
jgi:hypothetical protein